MPRRGGRLVGFAGAGWLSGWQHVSRSRAQDRFDLRDDVLLVLPQGFDFGRRQPG